MTGKVRWVHLKAAPSYSRPALSDGLLYFGSGTREVYAMSASQG
jgi:hypothetical protein